jgi:hypothetical protein
MTDKEILAALGWKPCRWHQDPTTTHWVCHAHSDRRGYLNGTGLCTTMMLMVDSARAGMMLNAWDDHNPGTTDYDRGKAASLRKQKMTVQILSDLIDSLKPLLRYTLVDNRLLAIPIERAETKMREALSD